MKTAKTTSEKIKEINIDCKSLDTWQEQLHYIVIQKNKLLFEKLSGMELSTCDVVTCSEITYFNKPTSIMAFRAAIKSIH